MPVFNRTPHRNLILTGSTGTGKTGVGRVMAQKLEDAAFVDMEIEIHKREGYTHAEIREVFGMARLRTVERDLIDELTLRRSSVIAVSNLTLLVPLHLERLRETGPVLCLTASLGEILRRLHVANGGWFHDPNNRLGALGRLKRERELLKLDLPKMDTTNQTIETVAQLATEFWMQESDV